MASSESPARRIVFGTAGHVDHGKSSLVLALTGTDPDRLAEEKARQMTIDLGFAFLDLPGFEEPVAIVDVPGHEMFVRNMVAGATGIDAAIFVVAADEGVMPQTVEHLDVLRYLQVSAGAVALTKADKAGPERRREVAGQVEELLRGTPLEGAPCVAVSAVTGEGLEELRAALAEIARRAGGRSSSGAFRLPIDRVFTLKGVGTVVTGTVISGSLEAGETVVCLPQERRLRARSVQVHNESVARVYAGQRAAVNLADAAKDEVHRGDVLATPGSLAPTFMVDARLNLSPLAPRPIEQRTRLRVHHGTREVMARVVLLEGDALAPGASALAQLRLEAPLVPLAGDPFVLRSYSPTRVIGGGTVVDAHPPKRRRSAGAEEVAVRETLPTDEAVLEGLDRAGAAGAEFDRVQVQSGLAADALRSLLGQLEAEGRAVAGRRGLWFSRAAVKEMESAIVAALARLHGGEPLRPFAVLNAAAAEAAPTAELRECFRIALEELARSGAVAVEGEKVRLSNHRPRWEGKWQTARDRILRTCRDSGLMVPSPEHLASMAGLTLQECSRVLEALAESGELRLMARDMYVHPEAFERCRAVVKDFLAQRGKMSVGEARDILGATRKYLLPFLEGLDREGLTAREGDYRVLRPRTPGT